MPNTILSRRVETFRDFYNITEPIIGDGSHAAEMDIKLVQYLLRCWAMSGGGAATVLRKEAARIASKPGFISGEFNPTTRRALQLFETDFELQATASCSRCLRIGARSIRFRCSARNWDC